MLTAALSTTTGSVSTAGWRRTAARAGVVAVVVWAGLAMPVTGAAATTPDPVVEGPIGPGGVHSRPANGYRHLLGLDAAGYSEQEYFFSGTARSIGSAAPTGPPVAAPVEYAPYKSRMIVRRPVDPQRFNGTVIVEWMNTTSGADADPGWIWAYPEMIREGYAYVAVSAQAAGVTALRAERDPVRYASLSHPGDQFALDIFSQAMQAARHPATVDVLGGLRLKRALATGESQSGQWLHDYLDLGVQREVGLADGFLLDAGGETVFTHHEPDVPVLHVNGEERAVPGPRSGSPYYRSWWIAGAPHADAWSLAFAQADQRAYTADDDSARFDEDAAGSYGEQGQAAEPVCATSPNLFPRRYALDAAYHTLDHWLRDGTAPDNSPEFVYTPDAGDQPTIVGQFTLDGTVERDEDGNVLGGLRLPPIEVPLATYNGNQCWILGYAVPFSDDKLLRRYPTFADYFTPLKAAAERSVEAGHLRPADARDLLSRACSAARRWPSSADTRCSTTLN